MQALRTLALAVLISASAGAAAALAAGAPQIVLLPAGPAEVRQGLNDEWRPVHGRTFLKPGEQVRTPDLTGAQILFADGSRIALSPKSVFSVDEASSKQALFTLAEGRLRAFFAGVFTSRMSVRTTNAVCAVRGTEFEVGADNNGRTDVSVREGHLEVSDNDGHKAVVTSEETVAIGDKGLERPHMVSLHDERARPAANPFAVRMEMANDATRSMLEDLRNHDLKANEAQLGKDVIDAFGRRVRLEEYLLRPANNQFKLLFLTERKDRFDWGDYIETFHAKIPDDITQVAPIVAGTFFSKTQPSNWLTNIEFFATNTQDSIKETIALGDPVAINFSGFGAGTLFYPSSQDYKQILSGPGVPGGTRTQFEQTEDWNTTTPGQFTYSQLVHTTLAAADPLANMITVTLDPTNATDVQNGFTNITAGGPGNPLYDNTNTTTSSPRGPSKADLFARTDYADGSFVSVEKILVSNKGDVLDFAAPTAPFDQSGNYNLEFNIGSSFFQGRDIDVMIAPEILNTTSHGTQSASQLKP